MAENPFDQLTEQQQKTLLALNACIMADDLETFKMLMEDLPDEIRSAMIELFNRSRLFLSRYFEEIDGEK